MKCPACPVRACLDCLGEIHPPVCRDVASGMPGRAEQLVNHAEGRTVAPPAPSVADLAAVSACPDRGGVLPISMQPDCGCSGRELSGCRAGKGTVPGRVTLRECLSCRSGAGHPAP